LALSKAIELQPDFALAHVNLGNLLADRRDFASAAAAFRKAMELDPGDARAFPAITPFWEFPGKEWLSLKSNHLPHLRRR
jgi:tetratricopeptide (TPR) repeat protein